MKPIDKILDALHRLNLKTRNPSSNKWTAQCPAHKDRSPSLAIKELEDGRLLIKCMAGCATPDVLAAMGLSLGDLWSKPLVRNAPPINRHFYGKLETKIKRDGEKLAMIEKDNHQLVEENVRLRKQLEIK